MIKEKCSSLKSTGDLRLTYTRGHNSQLSVKQIPVLKHTFRAFNKTNTYTWNDLRKLNKARGSVDKERPGRQAGGGDNTDLSTCSETLENFDI